MATKLANIAENITPADVKTAKDAQSLNARRIKEESRNIADDAAEYLADRGIIARFDLSHYLA